MSLPLNHEDEGTNNANVRGIRLCGGSKEIDGIWVTELGGPGTGILSLVNLFTKEDCDKILGYYRLHTSLERQGRTVGGVIPTKNCREVPLLINSEDARRLDLAIFEKMQRAMSVVDKVLPAYLDGKCKDSSYLIQRYATQDEFYHWHVDCGPKRRMAVILYLNDVAEGGETEFWYQNVLVKPETSKLMVFPASAGHTHRGRRPLSGEKFIMTTFILGETVP